MREKENAPSMTAITERAEEMSAYGKAMISCLNFNTGRNRSQIKIAGLLNYGAENAIPLRELGSMTGLDGRVIRRMVEKERRSGVPICSNTSTGFFLASSHKEVNLFVRQMRSRAREILKTADAVEQCVTTCWESESR